MDTLNVLVREGRALLRGANAYILRLPDAPIAAPAPADAPAPAPAAAPADAPAAELNAFARMQAALARCAPFFRGLVMRSWGLNRAPVATHPRRWERRPAPD